MIRVAVVGCGWQGALHLTSYAGIDDVEIVAIVDRSADRLAEVGERFGIPADRRWTSHEELSPELELDLVSVATMPSSHMEIALGALAVGANVLCEKPVARNATEVERIIAAAQAADRFVTAGFNMRSMGSARCLRGLVADGTLGRPVAIRATCLSPQIPWWGPHYVKELAGGGVIAADAEHVIDLALWIAGWPRPRTVSASACRLFPLKRASTAPSAEAAARYDVEDTAGGFIRLEGGSWLTLELGWTADLPQPDVGVALQCEHGSARLDPLRVMVERDGEPIDVTPAVDADVAWDPSVSRGIAGVVAAIRDNASPLVTPEQMLDVQRTIDAIYVSVERDEEVVLP